MEITNRIKSYEYLSDDTKSTFKIGDLVKTTFEFQQEQEHNCNRRKQYFGYVLNVRPNIDNYDENDSFGLYLSGVLIHEKYFKKYEKSNILVYVNVPKKCTNN